MQEFFGRPNNTGGLLVVRARDCSTRYKCMKMVTFSGKVPIESGLDDRDITTKEFRICSQRR